MPISSLSAISPLERPRDPVSPVEAGGRNRLLGSLPQDEFSQLAPHFKEVLLEKGKVLQEPGETIGSVYFPHGGMISVEESVYVGQGSVRRAEQLVLSGFVKDDPVETAWTFEQVGADASTRSA